MEKEDKPKIEDLQKKIEECEKTKAEYLAGWQRARADFINYKKEEMERIEQFLKYGEEEFILKILPVLDNFDLAARQNLTENLSGQEKEKIDKVVQGFLQIKNQLLEFLKERGIEEIKTIGEKFDPNFHEAVGEIETKDKEPGTMGEEDKSASSTFPSGQVIEEVRKGYTINSRLLRPAKVKVTK